MTTLWRLRPITRHAPRARLSSPKSETPVVALPDSGLSDYARSPKSKTPPNAPDSPLVDAKGPAPEPACEGKGGAAG